MSSRLLFSAIYPFIFRMHCGCVKEQFLLREMIVTHVNKQLLQDFPGDEVVYKSVDTVPDKQAVLIYPTEFLNSLEPSGIPPHIQQLKVGVPVMVLCNVDPLRLCNGTRCIVNKFMRNSIEATIVTGPIIMVKMSSYQRSR